MFDFLSAHPFIYFAGLVIIAIIATVIKDRKYQKEIQDQEIQMIDANLNLKNIFDHLDKDRPPLMHWHQYRCGRVLAQDNFTNDPEWVTCPICKHHIS
jgi:hypothetical protein